MDDRDRRAAALDQVLELTVLLGDDMRRSLARDGLTPSRTHLLWVLRASGPSTQRDLAAALDVSPRNVTGLVDALVDTGFVTREPHPGDRRATLVTLTDHGTAVMAVMERGHVELADQLFDGLTPRRLSAFTGAMDDVLERLRVLAGSQTPDDGTSDG